MRAMFEKKFIGITVLITAVVLMGGIFAVSSSNNGDISSQATMSADAKATAEETSHDWGEIGLNDGDVEKVFKISNVGSDTLKLSNVTTSCMCTTAQLILGDKTSPVFGMHSKSSYVFEVPPGQTAELKVIFDPAFHGPSGVGPINRQINVTTNDASSPDLNFILIAMVRK